VPVAPSSRRIAIAAGSNLGNAAASVRRAFDALSKSPLIHAPRLSPLYQTEPVRVSPDGPDPGGAYVNAAIVATSFATPQQLLELLQQIERQGGRDRAVGASPHGAPRPIDLDLLLVGDLTLDTPELTLPHPRMHRRAFVLVPLADIAPDLQVPGQSATVAQLLARLGPLDARAVRKITP